MTRTLTITHEDTEYVARIATIEKTFLGANENSHGIWTATLHLAWSDSWAVDLGGYNMLAPYGMTMLRELVETAGVESWEQLRGTRVIALFDEHDVAVGIAHLLDDSKVLILKELVSRFASQVPA